MKVKLYEWKDGKPEWGTDVEWDNLAEGTLKWVGGKLKNAKPPVVKRDKNGKVIMNGEVPEFELTNLFSGNNNQNLSRYTKLLLKYVDAVAEVAKNTKNPNATKKAIWELVNLILADFTRLGLTKDTLPIIVKNFFYLFSLGNNYNIGKLANISVSDVPSDYGLLKAKAQQEINTNWNKNTGKLGLNHKQIEDKARLLNDLINGIKVGLDKDRAKSLKYLVNSARVFSIGEGDNALTDELFTRVDTYIRKLAQLPEDDENGGDSVITENGNDLSDITSVVRNWPKAIQKDANGVLHGNVDSWKIVKLPIGNKPDINTVKQYDIVDLTGKKIYSKDFENLQPGTTIFVQVPVHPIVCLTKEAIQAMAKNSAISKAAANNERIERTSMDADWATALKLLTLKSDVKAFTDAMVSAGKDKAAKLIEDLVKSNQLSPSTLVQFGEALDVEDLARWYIPFLDLLDTDHFGDAINSDDKFRQAYNKLNSGHINFTPQYLNDKEAVVYNPNLYKNVNSSSNIKKLIDLDMSYQGKSVEELKRADPSLSNTKARLKSYTNMLSAQQARKELNNAINKGTWARYFNTESDKKNYDTVARGTLTRSNTNKVAQQMIDSGELKDSKYGSGADLTQPELKALLDRARLIDQNMSDGSDE